MLYCALGTSDHPSLRFTMDRTEVHQVSTLFVQRHSLMTNRPRNRRIAEENYDAAEVPQSSDKDLEAKDAAFDRVMSVGSDARR